MPKQKYVVKIEVSGQEAHDKYKIEIANAVKYTTYDEKSCLRIQTTIIIIKLYLGFQKKNIYTFLKT